MTPARSGTAGGQSLYDDVTSKLPNDLIRRCEQVFAGYQIMDDAGGRYRVGPIIRAAWEAERQIPSNLAKDISTLFRNLFAGGTLASYSSPTCCTYHSRTLLRNFAHPDFYPPDSEMLSTLAQLIWALLPHLRGILRMNPTGTSPKVFTSRFMVLENFLRWHNRDVLGRVQPLNDAVQEYIRVFSPAQNSALRRAELRTRLGSRLICGMVGARAEPNPMKPDDPHYCRQCRPFSAPSPASVGDKFRETNSPDAELKKLGLQFDSGQQCVELIYQVDITPDRARQVDRPAVPTIVDAAGYWLFRPDRSTAAKSGIIWNYTRNIATNKRGRRELIAAPLPVSRLHDLIVWPKPTSGNWTVGAAHHLATDLVV